MKQETKINAREIMAKLAELQSDVHYIKEHLFISKDNIEARKKEISENYKKNGFVTDKEWEFCEKADWHPVDELPLKDEHIKELKRRLREETPIMFNSVGELINKNELH